MPLNGPKLSVVPRRLVPESAAVSSGLQSAEGCVVRQQFHPHPPPAPSPQLHQQQT